MKRDVSSQSLTAPTASNEQYINATVKMNDSEVQTIEEQN
jgi:hypothetical protein